jgi:hypothetical protein
MVSSLQVVWKWDWKTSGLYVSVGLIGYIKSLFHASVDYKLIITINYFYNNNIYSPPHLILVAFTTQRAVYYLLDLKSPIFLLLFCPS